MKNSKKEFIKHYIGKSTNFYTRAEFKEKTDSYKIPNLWRIALNENNSLKDAISLIWNKIGESVLFFTSLLNKNVNEIYIVADENKHIVIGLIYQTCNDEYKITGHWFGGLPVSQEFHVDRDIYMYLPNALWNLYSIHNGLLYSGMGEFGIRPIEDVGKLIELCEVLEENQPVFDPYDYLAFCGDGIGNERCFKISEILSNPDIEVTYDWDHETNEIGYPLNFWHHLIDIVLNN